jgi:FlgD Ig-like domain/PGAP1-like protein
VRGTLPEVVSFRDGSEQPTTNGRCTMGYRVLTEELHRSYQGERHVEERPDVDRKPGHMKATGRAMRRTGYTAEFLGCLLVHAVLLSLAVQTAHAARVVAESQRPPDECEFITVFNDARTDPGRVLDVWVLVDDILYLVRQHESVQIPVAGPTELRWWECCFGCYWDWPRGVLPGGEYHLYVEWENTACAYNVEIEGPGGTMDFIDPFRLLQSSSANIWDDYAAWVLSTDKREGVVADGLTRLVTRIHVGFGAPSIYSGFVPPTALSADVQIAAVDDEAGDIGSLSSLDGANVGAFATLPIVEVGNIDYALGLYHAPAEFIRDGAGDNERDERSVAIQASVLFSDGQRVCLSDTLRIRRPPVALIHGVWSSAQEAFPRDVRTKIEAKGEFDTQDHRLVFATDYSSSSHGGYARNAGVPRRAVENALARERDNGIAATRADVVAHSLGGILTRFYTQNDGEYLRPDNYLEGDVYRLVTIDTPHMGTPVADFMSHIVEAYQANPQVFVGGAVTYSALEKKVTRHTNGFNGGAMNDLKWESDALLQLQQFGRPCHAFVGTTQSISSSYFSQERLLWWFMSLFVQTASPQLRPSTVFCGETNDLIVGARSQRAGVHYIGQLDASHTQAVSAAAPLLDALLDTPLSDPVWSDRFAGNAATLLCPPAVATERAAQVASSLNAILPASVVITQPAAGQSLSPGQTVQLQVQVQGAPADAFVVVATENDFEILEGPPFAKTWQVPVGAIGAVQLTAFAGNDSLLYGMSASVDVPVVLNEPPVKLEILPTKVLLGGPGDLFVLSVFGTWTNGVERDVTMGNLGTTYSTSNSSVATVTPDGVVIARGKGPANISAHFMSKTATSAIEVMNTMPVPSPDGIAPFISFSHACPDTFAASSHPTIEVEVSDELSGIAFQSVTNGVHDLETMPPGWHTCSVTARDHAGNESTTQCDYFTYDDVTAVAFASFVAEGYQDGARLRWKVASADGLAGFNIYRSGPQGMLRLTDVPLSASAREYVDRKLIPGTSYTYQVGAMDADGEFMSPTGKVSMPVLPLTLYPSTPNPFSAQTDVSFYLPEADRVELAIYDVAGRRVRVLTQKQMALGTHTTTWDGKDTGGRTVPSGVYFSRLVVGGRMLSQKVVVAR